MGNALSCLALPPKYISRERALGRGDSCAPDCRQSPSVARRFSLNSTLGIAHAGSHQRGVELVSVGGTLECRPAHSAIRRIEIVPACRTGRARLR